MTTAAAPWWQWRARVTNVVDGDTADVFLDQGFYSYAHPRIRLDGIDTAEIHNTAHDSDAYILGTEQTEFVEKWCLEATYAAADSEHLSADWPVVLVTTGETGKYGRFLADVYRRDTGESLCGSIITEYPDAEDS